MEELKGVKGERFTGQVKVGTISNIEVYYNGIDQHMKLPIKLLKSPQK